MALHATAPASNRTGSMRPSTASAWRNTAAAGLFAGLGWAAPQLGDRLEGAMAAAAIAPITAASHPAPVTFVAQAAGTVVATATVYAAPAGGAALTVLPAGAPVSIGGVVRVPAGLWVRDVLWIGMGGEAAAPGSPAVRGYGFVPASTVAVTAGTPLRLDVDAVSRASMLAPSPAVLHAGGELDAAAGPAPGGGAVAGDTAVDAAVVDAADAEPAPAPDLAIPWLPHTVQAWAPEITSAAARHGIDPLLVAIVMLVESGGDPAAISPSGAVGLMQVMPGTGADIARRRGIAAIEPGLLADPATNVDFGAWYLAQQLGAFGVTGDPGWQQSVELAAAAYNGGPGSVQRLLAGGALPDETSRYRAWVGGMWREREAAGSPTFEAWWRAGGSRLVAAAERTARQP